MANHWLDNLRDQYEYESTDPMTSTNVDTVVALLGIGQELERLNARLAKNEEN